MMRFVNVRFVVILLEKVFSCDRRGVRVASFQMNRNTLEYGEEKYGIASFCSFNIYYLQSVPGGGWG